MSGYFGLALAFTGLALFAWSWSKMPNILDEWKDKKDN